MLSPLPQASDSLPRPLSFIALIPVVPVGAADVGYLTAVSPAAATLFSLVLMRLKSAVSKPVMMAFASLLYGALCVFIYLSSSIYLKQLGWSISILYAVGQPYSLNCTPLLRAFVTRPQAVLGAPCLRARTRRFSPTCFPRTKTQHLQRRLLPAAAALLWHFLCFLTWIRV